MNTVSNAAIQWQNCSHLQQKIEIEIKSLFVVLTKLPIETPSVFMISYLHRSKWPNRLPFDVRSSISRFVHNRSAVDSAPSRWPCFSTLSQMDILCVATSLVHHYLAWIFAFICSLTFTRHLFPWFARFRSNSFGLLHNFLLVTFISFSSTESCSTSLIVYFCLQLSFVSTVSFICPQVCPQLDEIRRSLASYLRFV